MSYIEFFGTIFNIICVYLVARNNIWNWPIGILGVILYIFLFYQIQLYSDLLEQVYFLITWFYGWYVRYTLGNKNTDTKTAVYHTTSKENIIYLTIIIIGTLLLSLVTSNLHIRFAWIFPEAASFPLLDAFTTILSFAATILMARKKIECWYLWILVDIIGIGLYYTKGVKFISLEYVLFLVLALWGLIQWLRIYRKQN